MMFFQLVHVYAPNFFEPDPDMPAWPTQNLDTMRLSTKRFLIASEALNDAVEIYDSSRFSCSVLAAATFHLAYDKSNRQIFSS
jgi:hypothetical protein